MGKKLQIQRSSTDLIRYKSKLWYIRAINHDLRIKVSKFTCNKINNTNLMSTGQKIIFGRNSVSDNLTDLKVLYLPKFSEQNALPKTLPLEVLGFPEFLYMTHKCLVSQSNWVQMESKLVIKVFVATVAFFLTYCSRLFFSHIDQLALTFFHNPKHEGLFCMYEVKIMKSTTHSMHNSGLFRHKFVYSFIGRDILNC